jgi:hypothetical protein
MATSSNPASCGNIASLSAAAKKAVKIQLRLLTERRLNSVLQNSSTLYHFSGFTGKHLEMQRQSKHIIFLFETGRGKEEDPMRRLAFFLVSLLILANGCVISPRRTVGSTTGSGGGNSEFSLTVNPTSQSITAGASGTYSISVTGTNGFTGTVNLSASSSISGIVASFDTTSITGGSGSATLTVQTTSTSSGTATITVFASDPSNNVSQSLSVTASVTAAASTAGAIISASSATVPAGCISSPAGSNAQRVSFPATPATGGFTATFAVTPSSAAMYASLGFFAPASSGQPALSSLIKFNSTGVIQARDGDTFAPSAVPYAAGETYQFRLVENLPAATYSVFATPPGASEIPLGTNLQVPTDQRGATTLTGWGIQVSAPDNATLSVCNFKLH